MKRDELTEIIRAAAADPERNIHGLNRNLIRKRMVEGKWTLEKALSTPKINPKKYSDEILDLAEENGISPEMFRSRINKGWSEHAAATTPKMRHHEAGRLGRKKSHWGKYQTQSGIFYLPV